MSKHKEKIKMAYKTNEEVEILDTTGRKSWVLTYATGSDFYIPDALHVERNDSRMLVNYDEEASENAMKWGIPLIFGMKDIPDEVYVDTEENRNILEKMLKKYPDYKTVVDRS